MFLFRIYACTQPRLPRISIRDPRLLFKVYLLYILIGIKIKTNRRFNTTLSWCLTSANGSSLSARLNPMEERSPPAARKMGERPMTSDAFTLHRVHAFTLVLFPLPSEHRERSSRFPLVLRSPLPSSERAPRAVSHLPSGFMLPSPERPTGAVSPLPSCIKDGPTRIVSDENRYFWDDIV